jgi:tripartite-type tricarboxylate transporter receptor subunit TctC
VYPSRPIRLILANTAGTPGDVMMKIINPRMARVLGQPVEMEYMPGPGMRRGFEHTALHAPADGYTMVLAVVPSLASLPLGVRNLPFDPLRDLPPVINLAEMRYVFGSSATKGWRTLDELKAACKAHPGRYTFGAPGSIVRLQTEALLHDLGLSVRHVAFTGGGDSYLPALRDGGIDMGLVGISMAVEFGDRYRVLAMEGRHRSSAYPDAATFAELGMPYVRGLSYSLNVRAGTPADAVARLHAAATDALAEAEVKSQLGRLGYELTGGSTQNAITHLDETARHFAALAKRVDFQPQN